MPPTVPHGSPQSSATEPRGWDQRGRVAMEEALGEVATEGASVPTGPSAASMTFCTGFPVGRERGDLGCERAEDVTTKRVW